MKIEKMSMKYYDDIMAMAMDFYAGPALLHKLSQKTIEKIDEENKYIDGFIVTANNRAVAMCSVSKYFETEVAGICVQILDLYVSKEYRGMGIATQIFNFITENNPNAKRFRLEAAPDNVNAIKLYEKIGFKRLGYVQMVKEM